MKVILKPGREKSVLRRHPWIFSGAIQEMAACEDGSILPIYSSTGEFLAQGYFHNTNSLSGRILAFDKTPVEEVILDRLCKAWEMRKRLFDRGRTNCFRLINAEGDGIPGLIVDCYDDVLVLQANTCGIEKLKPFLIASLVSLVQPKSIYEKSLSSARGQEGLPEIEGTVWGAPITEVSILENGLKFLVSLTEGQKTGLFLDQREMRRLIAEYAPGKRVLNCFSYTGGFSLFALQGGAAHVDSVDISSQAAVYAKINTEINGFDLKKHSLIEDDVFAFLRRSSLQYDIVILDPPAFAKKRNDVENACKAYKEINQGAMAKMPAGSLLLTCSCSYHIDGDLFQNLLFQAAYDAKRSVKIVGRHKQAADHPISLYHPEGEYLKSVLLYLD